MPVRRPAGPTAGATAGVTAYTGAGGGLLTHVLGPGTLSMLLPLAVGLGAAPFEAGLV